MHADDALHAVKKKARTGGQEGEPLMTTACPEKGLADGKNTSRVELESKKVMTKKQKATSQVCRLLEGSAAYGTSYPVNAALLSASPVFRVNIVYVESTPAHVQDRYVRHDRSSHLLPKISSTELFD